MNLVPDAVLFLGMPDSSKQWNMFIEEYLTKLVSSNPPVPRGKPSMHVGINLDAAVEEAEKLGKSYLNPKLIEIVFKDGTLDSKGKLKKTPILSIISDRKTEILSPIVTPDTNINTFLKELNNLDMSENMRTRAVFVVLFSTYLFFYSIMKWQNDSVPGLLITSKHPEVFFLCNIYTCAKILV